MITSMIAKDGTVIIWKDGKQINTEKKVPSRRKSKLNQLRHKARMSERERLITRLTRYGSDIPEDLL